MKKKKRKEKHCASGWMSRLSAAGPVTHLCVTVIQTASERTGRRRELKGLNFSNHSPPPVALARQRKSESRKHGHVVSWLFIPGNHRACVHAH